MSAMVVSSVSPLRWLMIVVNLFRFASSTASSVSVSVPIWFTFTRMLLPQPFVDAALAAASTLVTNRSSPTSWTLPPSSAVSFFQPSQSSSDRPSSIERIGHLRRARFQKSIISSDEMILFGSLLKKQ